MNRIYRGSFKSVDGVDYRVDIYSADSSRVEEELKFAYDTPVEIEWNEVDKLEPIQGSCMTLKVQSLRDRQFIKLYAIESGSVRADVWRNGELYWSGMLDTELYEEPYSTKSDYDVTFSFSDFAVLERKKWELKGVSSIQEILSTCINAMGINYNEVKSLISTTRYNYVGATLDFNSLYLLNDNFYDEDGEPMSMREVLEEVLRPFALRIVQKGGSIHIYDLNALYHRSETEEVWWKSSDATLGVDVVYNNVKVTFSPYADTKLIDGSLDHKDVLKDSQYGRTYKTDYDWNADPADGFKIHIGDQEGLPLQLQHGAKFFRIDSAYSGNDEAGVAWAFKGNAEQNYGNLMMTNGFSQTGKAGTNTDVIITTKPAFLGYSSYRSSEYKLKISLNVLFDVRYNPFEDSGKKNESGNWERLQDWCNFGYIPVMLRLKDNDGNVLYHYENSAMIDTNGYNQARSCKWVRGDGPWGCMRLCYYDFDNRKSASGFGGWKTNRPIIGYFRDGLPKKWKAMGEGEYIDLPPFSGGFLELEIGRGIYQFDYKREEKDIYSRARWLLYKDPKVELVSKNGTAITTEDVEDTAWINKQAREDLSIDTIVGTGNDDIGGRFLPSARGVVMDAGLVAATEFARAGVSDRLERLLIGTVYSQYATRHNSLSGTVRLLPTMKVLTDASSIGKYICLHEVQNLMQDSSEITMVELSEDNYEGVEYT